jgi:hypothetical protein
VSSLLGKLIGNRAIVTRQGTKDSGFKASVQTFTSIVTMDWTWDHVARVWRVRLVRVPIDFNSKTPIEVLWEGAVNE